MIFIDKIIARLAGFDAQEIEATLARTQPGHAAMPDPKANLQDDRARVHQDMNLQHEKENIQYDQAVEQVHKQEADQHGGIAPDIEDKRQA